MVSSVFGRQFSNMAARTGSFMRLLTSKIVASITGETIFLCYGGGLAQEEASKTRIRKARVGKLIALVDIADSSHGNLAKARSLK